MLKQSKVVFNQENHTYKLGDKFLNGITGILSKHLFPDKYSNIPEYILEKAAERGTYIHNCCELIDTLGVESDCTEAQNYVKLKEQYLLEPIANEYIVSDNKHFASSIDVVYRGNILADIKTTSKLDLDYIQWQLSIYKYLFELQNPKEKVTKLYAIWLRGETHEVKEVTPIAKKYIKELLEAEVKGVEFSNPIVKIENNVPIEILDAQAAIITVIEEEKRAAEKKQTMLNRLLNLMEEHGADKWSTDRMTMTRVPSTTAKRFDSKKLKEEQPEVYNSYITESIRKSSIKLTIKETI